MPNIAVLSTAHIHAAGFLDNLAAGADGRRIHAIWDDVVPRGQAQAQRTGSRFVASLDALLAEPGIDGFVICAENTRHLELLERVLPLGRPVFCEKPLATTAAEARRAADLARRHATPLICGYFQPFSGANRAVAAALAEKRIGQVTRIRFRNAHHAAYGRWFDKPELAWFHDPALSGGGAFLDMGTHAVHLLRHLCGPVHACFAEIANHSGQYPACDDWGVAHLRFASGVLGTVEAGWTQTGGIGGLEVVGSTGCIYHDGTRLVLSRPGSAPEPLPPAAARPDRIDRLVAAIQGRIDAVELSSDLDACVDAAVIMASCYVAASSGTWTPTAGTMS